MRCFYTIWLSILLLVFCCYSYAEELPTITAPAISQFRLEQKIQSLTNEISDIEEGVNATESAIHDLEKRKKLINALTINFDQSQNALTELRLTINKWSALASDQKIQKGELYAFRNNVNSLIERPFENLQRSVSDIQSYYFPSMYRRDEGDFSYLKHFESVLRQSGEGIRYSENYEQIYSDFDALIRSFQSDENGIVDTPVNRIKSYLSTLKDKLKVENDTLWRSKIQGFYDNEKKRTISWLDTLIANLTEHKTMLSERINKLENELTKLDKQYQVSLDNSDKAKRLSSSYESLSVNFMIGGIILILIILLFMTRGNTEIAEKLIERRTLVEILSMGFLLLAVIILGTSDKINAETLGTLLGTIAGYVFGKQMAERSGQEANHNVTNSADAKNQTAD